MRRSAYRRRGRPIILNLIAGLLLVVIYFLFRGSGSLPARDIHVVDGDTIKCVLDGKNVTVRLLGIDCPETRMTDKLKEQAADMGIESSAMLQWGNMATMKMKALTGNGELELVTAPGERKQDRWGRLLAYVEVDGVDVGASLLKEGLAWEYKCRHPRRKMYIAYVTQARADKVGVWAK